MEDPERNAATAASFEACRKSFLMVTSSGYRENPQVSILVGQKPVIRFHS